MTKEQDESTAAALVRERAGYEQRLKGAQEDHKVADKADLLAVAEAKTKVDELNDRIGQVDAQLRALGQSGKAPAKRAAKR